MGVSMNVSMWAVRKQGLRWWPRIFSSATNSCVYMPAGAYLHRTLDPQALDAQERGCACQQHRRSHHRCRGSGGGIRRWLPAALRLVLAGLPLRRDVQER